MMSSETRQRRYQRRKIEAGLCAACGQRPPAPRRIRCELCLEKDRERRRARYERSKKKSESEDVA